MFDCEKEHIAFKNTACSDIEIDFDADTNLIDPDTFEYYKNLINFQNRGVYFIHDNYMKPFKIEINDKTIKIWKFNSQRAGIETIYHDLLPEQTDLYDEIILNDLLPEQIFIGESPLNERTIYSGGYGPHLKGNTFLLEMSDNEYIHIGMEIYKFTTNRKIISYISPVGNNDISYPYAIDEDEYYYLMLEKTKINIPEQERNEPYNYFYKTRIMKNEICCKSFENIQIIHERNWNMI